METQVSTCFSDGAAQNCSRASDCVIFSSFGERSIGEDALSNRKRAFLTAVLLNTQTGAITCPASPFEQTVRPDQCFN